MTRGPERGRLGASPLGDRTRFEVWSPFAERVHLHLLEPHQRLLPMEPREGGYHLLEVEDAGPGARYRYQLGGPEGRKDRPDPASRSQPEGVHGPSEVIDPAFAWSDHAWDGIPLERYAFYELHVGTFSPSGTFEGVIPHLDDLVDLGVTAVELMPVAQFPGERNWGYDGAHPFAVQRSYGGPGGLARLVDACHARGLAVVLDVVYNHLGPEGNYLGEFGPYFTDRYLTPWGEAINLDGPHSDQVRRYFIENALMWIEDFHIDALRLDAVHALFDQSPRPFLAELAEAVHRRGEELGRRCHLIAEDHRNDPRLVRAPERGGLGLDAVWSDDLHHALHTILTGERHGYYADYRDPDELVRALRHGFAYRGRHSRHLRRRRGAPAEDLPGAAHVVFAQNHDQVGNRMRGKRLTALAPFEAVKLAAGLVLLSPYLPLIFMGEEYGETAPFLYFVDHGDPELTERVERGRREEFAGFGWEEEPPDPADPETFRRSRLDHDLASAGRHRALRDLYRRLLALRREVPALARLDKGAQEVDRRGPVLTARRTGDGSAALGVFNLGEDPARAAVRPGPGRWERHLDSADSRWAGPGSQLPETLEGPAELPLPPYAYSLYVRLEVDQ